MQESRILEVPIPRDEIPEGWGNYERHVLERGHRAEVISACNESGMTDEERDSRLERRKSVRRFVAKYGVLANVILPTPDGWARVWYQIKDRNRPKRVRLVLV